MDFTKPEAERRRLRATFETVAELYDRARPSYPPCLFDDLEMLAQIPAGGRILEIGPGTAKATLPLAERGYDLVGLELGEELASVARRNLAGYPRVRVIHTSFESWEAGAQRFDAIVAFTAFHWIDPEVRFAKSAELLRPHGSLAVVATQHVLAEAGDEFWNEVQEDYDAVVPSDDNQPPPRPHEVPDLADEITASGVFGEPAVRCYLWDVTYSADQYIDLLDTYSGHRSLEPGKRELLYGRIRTRIESRPTPAVTKTYLATLNVASVRACGNVSGA